MKVVYHFLESPKIINRPMATILNPIIVFKLYDSRNIIFEKKTLNKKDKLIKGYAKLNEYFFNEIIQKIDCKHRKKSKT